jgi:outer membrane lipoprotein-sorting protein
MNKHFQIKHVIIAFVSILIVNSGFNFRQQKIDKISLDLISRALHNGKSVSVKSEVYYKSIGATMVTHFTSPKEKVVITNGNGEYKDYDFSNNTVTLMQGIDYSSKNSLFYNFLAGSTGDMGLKASGFRLSDTKIEKKMVITTWVPVGENSAKIQKAEIVHENYLPIYVAFYGPNNQPLQKSFYSNYQQVGSVKMPFTITEFEYMSPTDSIITKRVYSNLKINTQVDEKFLDFKIPSSAKVVVPNNQKIK